MPLTCSPVSPPREHGSSRAGCSQGLETGEKGVPRGQPCLVKILHFDLEGSGA